MKWQFRLIPFLASVFVHAALLFGLWKIVIAEPAAPEISAIETVLVDQPRDAVEIVQELDMQRTPAESINIVAGSVSNLVGGSNAPLAAAEVAVENPPIEEPTEIRVQTADRALPGQNLLSMDLGEGEITGEAGAVVSGYGEALDRLTFELLRLLRNDKLLVVWLFDESESMKDDQEEINARLGRVYDELQLVQTTEKAIGRKARLDDVLISAVLSFGKEVREITPRPTGDARALRAAIETIPIDKSGHENLCHALIQSVPKFRRMADRANRKLVFVVVSDESGDDEERVEDALQLLKAARAPMYILGRESVFGSLFAYVRWQRPVTNQVHYLPVRRGPETPFAELLQYNGYRRRRDAHMSGFGPYMQVRLCRETGGIFFQLPGEQDKIVDLDARKFDMLNLREYLPDLGSRRDYVTAVRESEFRSAIRNTVELLNPYNERVKKFLELPDPTQNSAVFRTQPARYAPRIAKLITQIVQISGVIAEAQRQLHHVKDLRRSEPEMRWRANYDLMTAQLHWYRLRLFEYALALDQFAKRDIPNELKRRPNLTHWRVHEQPSGKRLSPDEQQVKTLGVTKESLDESHQRAVAGLQRVIDEHPGTPWARRAQWELDRKFGLTYSIWRVTPQPNRPKPNRPRPTPPPIPSL